MMLSERVKTVVSKPEFLYWAASVNPDNTCELTRVAGFIVEEDNQHLTFFLPRRLFSIIEPTLQPGSNISFLMASIMDFESYQVKGEYISHRPCSEEDIDFYRLKILKITDILNNMGMDGHSVVGYLHDQPSIAVTIYCREAYEQTPKPDTGHKLTD